MTEHEQRIACAELQGWTFIEFHHDYNREFTNPPEGQRVADFFGCPPTEEARVYKRQIPNYPHDLNAMHEVEKTLSDDGEWDVYIHWINYYSSEAKDRAICNATASKKLEAYLRTKDKWKE